MQIKYKLSKINIPPINIFIILSYTLYKLSILYSILYDIIHLNFFDNIGFFYSFMIIDCYYPIASLNIILYIM